LFISFPPPYLIDPILAISNERLFHVCACRRLETNSVGVEVESAAGRRLCVFRDGLRERVARLFKRIFACDGLRVPVKELALAVDV
jgi:hypothetical protein